MAAAPRDMWSSCLRDRCLRCEQKRNQR
jgi:hypothetical protein